MGKNGTLNLFRFSTIMAVVGLLLGLMATGCSDSGGKGTADIPTGTSNKVSFVYNLLANKTDVANTIVEVGYEFFDAEGNEVLDTMDREDEYLLTHGTSDVESTVVVPNVPLTAKQVLATFYGAKGEALGIGVDDINITASRPQTIADPDVATGAVVAERLTGFAVTPDPQTIEVGQVAAYVATASYAKTKDVTYTVNLTNDCIWTVANEDVAHILYTMQEVPGSFQGDAAGNTLVSASYEVAGVSFADDAVLTVGKAMPADVAISLDGKTVADNINLFDIDSTIKLGAYAVKDGTLGEAVEGTFDVADDATVTVAEDGLVTFVAKNTEGVEVTFTPTNTELTGDTVTVFTYLADSYALDDVQPYVDGKIATDEETGKVQIYAYAMENIAGGKPIVSSKAVAGKATDWTVDNATKASFDTIAAGLLTSLVKAEDTVNVTFEDANGIKGVAEVTLTVAPGPTDDIYLAYAPNAAPLPAEISLATLDMSSFDGVRLYAVRKGVDGKPVAVTGKFLSSTPSILQVIPNTGQLTFAAKEGAVDIVFSVDGKVAATVKINLFFADKNHVAIIDRATGKTSEDDGFTGFKMEKGGTMEFQVANTKKVDGKLTISDRRHNGYNPFTAEPLLNLTSTNTGAAEFSNIETKEGLLFTNNVLNETNSVAEIQFKFNDIASKVVKVALSDRGIVAEGITNYYVDFAKEEYFFEEGAVLNVAAQEIAKENLQLNAVRILSDGTNEAIAGEYKITGDIATLTPTGLVGQVTVALKDAAVGGEGTVKVTFTSTDGNTVFTFDCNVFAATKLVVTPENAIILLGETTKMCAQYANDTIVGDNSYISADSATSDHACATVDKQFLIVTADDTVSGEAYIGVTKNTAKIGEYVQTLKGGVAIRVM